MTKAGAPRWNANLHAFEALLRRVPSAAQRGLDVGCGEGESARRLRRVVPSVVALDRHEPSVLTARARGDDIEYLIGDLETATLAPAAFDVVTSVAMLLHVEHRVGLRQLATLVAPGGLLLVVSLARSHTARDRVRDAWDGVALRRHSLRKGIWHTPSPKVWPPPLSYDEARAATLEVLPDAEFRRVPYFRYTICWQRPLAESARRCLRTPVYGPRLL